MIKSIKYVAIAFGLISLASCDFLDQVADERTEITINNESEEDKLVMLLNTAYPEGNFAWIAELSSDNLIDNQSPHYPSSPNDKKITTYYSMSANAKYDEELFRFDPANTANENDWDAPGFIWQLYYSSIATTNHAIIAGEDWVKRSGRPASDKVKAALAEARLIRAYDHFILASLFCQPYRNATDSRNDIGLPYVTEPETQLIHTYERGNVADLYKNIEADLEAGLADISDINYGNARKYHFNENAAKAFAARFYLYTRQYDKVIKYADEVLGTDSVSVCSKLLDYSKFDGCTYLDDYANVWQDPKADNNIMLVSTASILMRKMFGYRYSYAGEKCQQTLMVRTKSSLWQRYICPIQSIVSGMLFSSSASDYGFFSAKIGEQFEYSDKIAGIGTPHIIQRAFTCQELLLERAEAKILTGDLAGGAADLKLYWNSAFQRFSDKDKLAYAANFGYLTDEVIQSDYVARDSGDETVLTNNYAEWTSMTSTVSPDFQVPAAAVPYMNCLNDFRRYETCYEGLRYFDVKRWGIPYEHQIGVNGQAVPIEMPSVDARRALEVPWESLASGLESSRPQAKDANAIRRMTIDKTKFVHKPASESKN